MRQGERDVARGETRRAVVLINLKVNAISGRNLVTQAVAAQFQVCFHAVHGHRDRTPIWILTYYGASIEA